MKNNPLTKDKLNKYPEDIFIPLTKGELRELNNILRDVFGFPIDRVSAHMMRLHEQIIRDEILSAIALLREKICVDAYLGITNDDDTPWTKNGFCDNCKAIDEVFPIAKENKSENNENA